MKNTNQRINDEDSSVLNSLIAQYTEICQKENIRELAYIVNKLNKAWEDTRKRLYRE